MPDTINPATLATNALLIYDGACNPRALARELVKAIDYAYDQEGSSGAASQHAAPARLILAQLTFLMATSFDAIGGYTSRCGDVQADIDRCKALAN